MADGEVGEMLVHVGRRGYWNQRNKTRSTFEGYWTRTGDKYIRDREGRYNFRDDMFKVSGIWVSPFEVESALITHPAVLEAAAAPRPIRKAAEAEKPSWCCVRARRPRACTRRSRNTSSRDSGVWRLTSSGSLPKTATGKI